MHFLVTCGLWHLSSLTGIEPMPPALGAQRHNHCATGNSHQLCEWVQACLVPEQPAVHEMTNMSDSVIFKG